MVHIDTCVGVGGAISVLQADMNISRTSFEENVAHTEVKSIRSWYCSVKLALGNWFDQ
jgi:hypothetical protein